jgi:hypothetical protein
MRNGKGTPTIPRPASHRKRPRRLAATRSLRSGALPQAEGEGFEPSMVLPMPVFKTGAIGRSATPPCEQLYRPTPPRCTIIEHPVSQPLHRLPPFTWRTGPPYGSPFVAHRHASTWKRPSSAIIDLGGEAPLVWSNDLSRLP